jgi:hydrogenase maturation protein HypF
MQQRHIQIEVKGVVQGVGFRPFVYGLAKEHGLTGWVYNNGAGVSIAAQGEVVSVDAFIGGLRLKAPPLAQITAVEVSDHSLAQYGDFVIRESNGQAIGVRLLPPDIATCEDCCRELSDFSDRRFGYPFINCTNCGPRFTIIKDLPYDRPHTTMKRFPMCPDCQREYDDPANRRFHAQPNACHLCGPAYRLLDRKGVEMPGNAVEQAKLLLQQGCIIAVKGIGGYHLACDARNAVAVAQLRERKMRKDKPFAVLVHALASVQACCEVSEREKVLLRSTSRPIVLLRKSDRYDLNPEVAPKNPYVGVMLPYAPLHYLLCDENLTLVMTSGNHSDEPIAYQNGDAFERLGEIADYFLLHNRDIVRSCDDSVMRVFEDEPMFLRRSRGYAPLPIILGEALPPLLAVGAEQKNVFALTKEHHVFLSHHIGDLENLATLEAFTQGVNQLQRMLDVDPRFIAHDLHPEYLSTKFAKEKEMPLLGIQHHHAHIAGVMAEYGLKDPVIGVAFDGTGYGEDGHLWGGEFLVTGIKTYRRMAHLEYMPLLGGTAAIKQPWRIAYGYLRQLFTEHTDPPFELLHAIKPEQKSLLDAMFASRLNTPLTSSVGRLFDAVAATLNLRNVVSYEGQAAVELELLAANSTTDTAYSFPIDQAADRYIVRLRPLFESILTDLQVNRDVADMAASFHTGLAEMVADVVGRISRDTGIKDVALSGGVFQNYRLLTQVVWKLRNKDFRVYIHRLVPPNDGGIALGQAYIAAARLRE